jgi:excisionase family DNA binding protein
MHTFTETENTADPIRLVTVEQACSMLSLGRTTMYSLLNSGELPSYTIGRVRRIAVEDLRAYVAKQKDDSLAAFRRKD